MNENTEKNSTDKTTDFFCINVALPYHFPQPNCCSDYDAEIHMDYDAKGKADHLVVFTHSLDCDVWPFIV